MPEPLRFDPADYPALPRVSDEEEDAESRIVETLQVSGMKRFALDPDIARFADVEFVDDAGNHTLVEIKIRERDPRKNDLDWAWNHLSTAETGGRSLEVWFLNTERLGLKTMRQEPGGARIDSFQPLAVWERTTEGIFDRQRVVDEADDWGLRVNALYEQVQEWARDRVDVHFEQIRKVLMAEEIMQRFAVPDRELAILDILQGEKVVASFVPRGLWVIGAWGRIDIITENRTRLLVALKANSGFEWRVASPEDRRRMMPFNDTVLSDLLDGK